MQNKIHSTTAHLLPAVHCQAGTGNSKLEQENDKKDDHVLGARGQRHNRADAWQKQNNITFKPLLHHTLWVNLCVTCWRGGRRIQRRAWLGGGALLRWVLRWRWAAGRRPPRWPHQWCGCSTPSRTPSPMLPLRSAAARPAEGTTGEEVKSESAEAACIWLHSCDYHKQPWKHQLCCWEVCDDSSRSINNAGEADWLKMWV